MSKDSGAALNEEDVHPGPMVEIDFWEAKMMNLESIFEQMKCDTTKHMASILQITDRYCLSNQECEDLKI